MIPLELHKIVSFDGLEYRMSIKDIRWVLDQAANAGLPPVNYITQRSYKQDGATEVAFYLQPRTISIMFRHGGCSREEYWESRATILDALRPNRNGTYCTYIFTQADGTQRAIRGRPLTPNFPPNDIEEWDEWAFQNPIDILCNEPTWFDPTLNELIAESEPLSTREYTFGIPVAYYNTNVPLNTVSSGNYRIAQIFYVYEACTLKTLQLYLAKVGTPAGTITVRLETVSNHQPTGILVHANATATIDESSLTTSLALVTLDFTDFDIAVGEYAIVISSDRADSDANYIIFGSYYNSLLDDLISYWQLEESSGTRADSHGVNPMPEGGAGTAVGSAVGRQLDAADFALGKVLLYGTAAPFNFGDVEFLIQGWLWFDALPAANTDLIFRASSAPPNRSYKLQFATTPRLRFIVSGNGTAETVVTANTFGAVATGTWYFVQAWHDPTLNTINIAVNGVADSAAHTTGVFAASTATLQIGNVAFDGRIDEVGIWNRILSSTDRTLLYFAGIGKHYYDLRGNDPYFWQSWEKLTSISDWLSQGHQLMYDFLVEVPTVPELVFPITFPIVFTGSANEYTASISYVGTWYSYPVIVVTGATNGFSITHNELDKTIQYLNAVESGEVITITLGDMPTVISSIDGDVISSLSPDSDLQAFRIEPDPIVSGGINTFTIQASNTDGTTQFVIQYYTRYIGI